MNLISDHGLLTELQEQQLVGRLEELGIPRHHYGLARAVQSWQRAAVPPDVALALWLLRDSTPADGGLSRHPGLSAEDTGAAVRYIQLALAVGENTATDPAVLRGATWLLGCQLPDGSIPANLGFGFGEAGTTGRVLRVLSRLGEPSLAPRLERAHRYLLESAVSGEHGVAWSYSRVERTVVTGATSHVVLALLERDPTEHLIVEGMRSLLAAQDPSGGWSEVPGYAPTIHNTFNVVRAIRAARNAGVVGDAVASDALAAAADWFLLRLRRQREVRATADLAFALRLAAELEVLHVKAVERLALRLLQRRRTWLSPSADLYAETEIVALALMECSRHLDSAGDLPTAWPWRWTLPPLPPPFLCHNTYLHDLLYSAFRARWWVGAVDRLVSASLVERTIGLVLGIITSLGIVDDYVTSVFASLRVDARGVVTVSIILAFFGLWILVKTSWKSSALRALYSSFGTLAVALLLTWIFYIQASIFPSLVALVGLRWLIIDVISFTANASGLLDRLRFK